MAVVEEIKQPYDILIVFGIGPALRPWSERKEDVAQRRAGSSATPKDAWLGGRQLRRDAKANAWAAGILYKKGLAKKIFLTGGRTGVEGNDVSEAELMQQYLKHQFPDIPDEDVILEGHASNSIENYARTINIVDSQQIPHENVGYLAAKHHIERIDRLAQVFELPGEVVSSADVLMELEPRDVEGSNFVEQIYDGAQYTEEYQTDRSNERRWKAALESSPAYYLPQAALINNDQRLRRICDKPQVREFLLSKGYDLDVDSIGEIRSFLRSMPREFPDNRPEIPERPARRLHFR